MATKVETISIKELDPKRETYTAPFAKSDTDRAVFFGNSMIDNLYTSVTALTAEVWALRRRNKIVEALLQEKGITTEMVEKYVPSEAQVASWAAERDKLVGVVFDHYLRPADLPYASTLHPDKADQGGV